MPPTDWAIAMAAVLVGACLQGSLGFGLGLVAAPVLALLDPGLLPAVVLGMGVPLTILIAWRERSSLDLRRIGWAVVGRVIGTVAGSFAVIYMSQRWLAGSFAGALLLAVGLSLFGGAVTPTKPALFTAGVASGLMGTATSVGGPPMALLLQHERGPQLRAALASFMAFGSTLSLLALVVVGEFDRHKIEVTLGLAPVVVLGFVLSRWTNRVLDRGYTRALVLTFAGASAISILLRDVI